MNSYKTEQDFIWDTLDEIFPNTTSILSGKGEGLDTDLKKRNPI